MSNIKNEMGIEILNCIECFSCTSNQKIFECNHHICLECNFNNFEKCPLCDPEVSNFICKTEEYEDEKLSSDDLGINNLMVYATTYNVLRIMSGMAGLVYSN